VTCYFKAGATAQLTVDGDFNLGGAFANVTGQIVNEVGQLARSTLEALDNMVNWRETLDLIGPGDFELDEFVNFDVFDIDTDFDVELPDLPAVQLLFQIDSMDLYMEFDTTIAAGATLTIPLYQSQTAVGIKIAEGLEAGIFVTMDLILSVEGAITIRSGFHLLLEDPVGFNIALFGQNVSSIIL
jgi:hypothetical protein